MKNENKYDQPGCLAGTVALFIVAFVTMPVWIVVLPFYQFFTGKDLRAICAEANAMSGMGDLNTEDTETDTEETP